MLQTGKRVSRGEYILAGMLYSLVLLLVLSLLVLTGMDIVLVQSVYGIVSLVLFVVSVILMVRRAHDFGYTGRTVLLLLIPIFNIYWILKMAFGKGMVGDNQYGKDPLTRQPESNGMYWGVWFVLFVLTAALNYYAGQEFSVILQQMFGDQMGMYFNFSVGDPDAQQQLDTLMGDYGEPTMDIPTDAVEIQ